VPLVARSKTRERKHVLQNAGGIENQIIGAPSHSPQLCPQPSKIFVDARADLGVATHAGI